MNVGQTIKARRKELGFNADYLAEQLGVSRSTIFRYEKGEIEKLPTEILEKLADVLQTTPGTLMGWETEPSDHLLHIYSQLNDSRKSEVVSFAEYKLSEQNSSKIKSIPVPVPSPSEIGTMAAHSDDPKRKYSEEELQAIKDFADDEIAKYKKKNGLK